MFAFIPVILAAAAFVSAAPAFSPAIQAPSAVSRWTAGTQEVVSWDTAHVPEGVDTIDWISLYTRTDHSGAHFAGTLASHVDVHAGSVTVDVPADLTAGYYYIFLGNWDDVSAEFYIDDAEHPVHIDA